MTNLKSMVEKSRDLGPLPASVLRLASVIADPQSDIVDIVEAIRFDQALTASILREANSAGSASRRVITSIKDAAIRIGSARILSHCMASVLRSRLTTPLPGYGYGEQDLWRHSVASAIAAEELSYRAPTSGRGMEFTAVWEGVGKSNLTCEQAETAVFGFSHAAVGAEVIMTWGLPADIEAAVRYHHACPSPSQPCTDIVMVSNIIAHTMGEGLGHEGMSLTVDEEVSGRMGIKREEFERICARTADNFGRTLTLYV
jgi:HD-like signal output (HDOD) protein